MRWRTLVVLLVLLTPACETDDRSSPSASVPPSPTESPTETRYDSLNEMLGRLEAAGIDCDEMRGPHGDQRRQFASCFRSNGPSFNIEVRPDRALVPGVASGVYGPNWVVAIGSRNSTGPRYRAFAREVIAALGGEMENMGDLGWWAPDLETLAAGLGCNGLELVERPTLGAIEDGFCRVAGAKVRLRRFQKVTEPPRLTLPFRARGKICWVHGENWLSATRDSIAARRILETYGGTIRHECGTL